MIRWHYFFTPVLELRLAAVFGFAAVLGFTRAIGVFGWSFRTEWWWNGARCTQPSLRTIVAKLVGIIRSETAPHSGHFTGWSEA
jgi:hypothetical protein